MLLQYNSKDCINLILKELETNSFLLDLPDDEIEQYLLKIDEFSIFEKYYVDKQLAGFISYYCNNKETKEAFITLVLVDKKYRGMSIAQKLIISVISIVKDRGFFKCTLQVKVKNTSAIHLYKKTGFYETYRNADSIFMSILV